MLRPLREASHIARETFPACDPQVFSYGDEQYLLKNSPYGTLALIRTEKTVYLVAAERPAGGVLDPKFLDSHILAILQKKGLTAWKLVRAASINEAIRALSGNSADVPLAPEEPRLWSPYLSVLPEGAGTLLGAQRLHVLELLRATVPAAAGSASRPLPLVCGPDGVGKRFVAAKLRATLGGAGFEIPLSRLLVDRIFSTQHEMLLDTLLAAAAHTLPQDLLVLSDAELLSDFSEYACERILDEAGRVGRVLLLARRVPGPSCRRLLVFPLPGLRADEAAALVREEHADVSFSGAALDLLIQAATVPEAGVLPGRVNYLLRLALNMVEAGTGTRKVLAPDEVAEVIRLSRPAWRHAPEDLSD